MTDSTDTERPDPDHQRPEGVSDATVSALGKLSEALEAVEAARGHLYSFHRHCGTADLTLGNAVEELRKCERPMLMSGSGHRDVVKDTPAVVTNVHSPGWWTRLK